MVGSFSRALSPLALACVLAFAIGCGGPTVEIDDTRTEQEKNQQAAELNEVVFVDADAFAKLRSEGALVLDARGASDYEAGHVPGAVHADEKALFKDDQGMITADIVELQDRARSIGLKNDTPVVIYGGARSSKTARLFWSLEYIGHGQVHLFLDPYEELIEELGEEPETEAATAEGDFVVALRPSIYATAKEVFDAVNGDAKDVILIDTRRLSEYEGVEDRGDPRQGYIPGATYYYWEDVFGDDDKLRSKEELRAEFEAKGMLDPEVLIVPYCQTGTRSATIYAVFRWLGHDNVKNYDGSWVEWSRNDDYPVTVIEEPTTEEDQGE